MKKRILSILLALAMIFTLVPVTVFADAPYQVVSVDKTTVQQGETVNVKVTLPEGIQTAGSFTVNLKFDTTLFEVDSRGAPPKISATDEGFSTSEIVSIVANPAAGANTSGELTANASYTYNTMEVAGVTVIDAKLKAKASGVAAFSFSIFEITYSDSGTQYIVKKDELAAPPTITVLKAPISSVSATVDAPVKGNALATTAAVDSAAPYAAGTVEWYVGADKAAETIAKPLTTYTAKFTLTAKADESFDEALNGTTTTEGYAVTRDSDTVLTLTKEFDQTLAKEVPTINTNPSANVVYGDSVDHASLTGGAASVAGTFYWMDTVTSYGNAGSKTLPAKFVPTDSENFATVENIGVAVTVSAKPITITVADIDDQGYTGSEIRPAVTVTGDGKTLSPETDYDVVYEDNTVVGSAKATVKQKTGGNYTFTKVAKTFAIKAGTVTEEIKDQLAAAVTRYDGTYDGTAHDALTVGVLPAGWSVKGYSTDGSTFGAAMPQVKDRCTLLTYVKFQNANYADVVLSFGNEFVKMFFVSFLNSNIYPLKNLLTSRVCIFLETPYSKASSHFPIASHLQ